VDRPDSAASKRGTAGENGTKRDLHGRAESERIESSLTRSLGSNLPIRHYEAVPQEDRSESKTRADMYE
jgi:hypothetical protein